MLIYMKKKKVKLESFNNEQVVSVDNVENLVIRNYELEQEVFKAINLAQRATVRGVSSVLGISNVLTHGVSLESNKITTDKAEYWPLRLAFTFTLAVPRKRPFGTMSDKDIYEFYHSSNVAPLYIDSLVKPSNTGIANLFEKIFTTEFPGTFTIKYGRYVFCIDQLPADVLREFLILAKNKRELDLSWIAPLQDLLESMETPATAAAKKKVIVEVGEDDEESMPVEKPVVWAEPQMAKKVSSFHKKYNNGGLLSEIEVSVNNPTTFNWHMAHNQAAKALNQLIEQEKLVKAKINKEPF